MRKPSYAGADVQTVFIATRVERTTKVDRGTAIASVSAGSTNGFPVLVAIVDF